MPYTLFVSDIHLNCEQPHITQRFLYFLQQLAPQADALYVIGDLFEVWIGDDEQTSLHKTIAQAFQTLNTTYQVPIYFIHGNRDFCLGKRYAKQAGLTLLPLEKVINLYGQPWLIMHGDQLCTLDKSYQRYRRLITQSWLQKLLLSLPLRWRQTLANYLRKNSQQSTQSKDAAHLDVSLETVQAYCNDYQVEGIIHGHTHKGDIHLNESSWPRLVLNDWENHGNYIWFDDRHQFDLVYF